MTFVPPPTVHNDPPLNKRVYYRHLETGDRGYLVERDGLPAIRWDRIADDTTHQLDRWKKEEDATPLFSEHNVAMIAFAADKEVCRALGQVDIANRKWIDLSEAQRRDWMKDGPKAKLGPRREVFEAIKKALRGDVA